MQQPDTRLSLISRIQGGRNDLAWTEFVSAYEPFLRRLVERQGVPEGHVPDVIQQILAGIAKSVAQWQDDGNPSSFRRWLNRVARNVVIKFMKRERGQVRGRGGTDFLELLERTPDSESEEQVREYQRELVVWAAEQVQGEFRETSWKAFQATQVEGRSVAEVAAELGVTPGSIYMSRSRIMARIRSRLKDVTDE
jgi:RNA polymerase sigma-70 factor (ECF subfamily)